MRLFELLAWFALAAVLGVIFIGKMHDTLAKLPTLPDADRFEVVDGQRIPYWTTRHRGEPVRIYICPGQEPRVAIARQAIDCAKDFKDSSENETL